MSQAECIRYLLDRGISKREVAAMLGVKAGAVQSADRGRGKAGRAKRIVCPACSQPIPFSWKQGSATREHAK